MRNKTLFEEFIEDDENLDYMIKHFNLCWDEEDNIRYRNMLKNIKRTRIIDKIIKNYNNKK